MGAVNADEEKSLAGSHGVQGFPTIKIFSDKRNPTPYQGARTADGMIDAALEAIRKKVKGGKSGGGKKVCTYSSGSQPFPGCYPKS